MFKVFEKNADIYRKRKYIIGGIMSININSEASCRKAYLNYHCYGNSMGVSASEMGQITEVWKDRISSWQGTVSNDENEYEFDDSEFTASRNAGKAQAQEQTGYEGGKGDTVTRGVTDGLAGAGGALLSTGALNGALNSVSTGIGKTIGKGWSKVIGEKATSKGASQALDKGVTNNDCKASWIVAAPLSAATGVRYQADKPNKEQKEACDELLNEMGNQQSNLMAAQDEMAVMSEEIIALADEAEMMNEEANEQIEEQKTEYDMYLATYEQLKEKAESGQPLTETEKALYEEVVGLLGETGSRVAETQDETGEEVTELYDDMGTYQEGYDYAADTMATAEGITDFAESFDETTQTMCYVEAGAQTLNAASGAKAGLQAGKFAASGGWFTAWAWAFAAMGATGAATSGVGAAEQFKWAGDVGGEIAAREATQDLNKGTMDTYTEEIDAYDGMMTGVEELELEIPEDIEAPEDTALPATAGAQEEEKPKKPVKEEEQ